MAQLRTVMRLVGFNVHIDNARALSCNHAVVLARSDRWYQCGCGYEFAHIHLYLHIFAQWVSNIALWSCHQNASAERAHSIYIYIYIHIVTHGTVRGSASSSPPSRRSTLPSCTRGVFTSLPDHDDCLACLHPPPSAGV